MTFFADGSRMAASGKPKTQDANPAEKSDDSKERGDESKNDAAASNDSDPKQNSMRLAELGPPLSSNMSEQLLKLRGAHFAQSLIFLRRQNISVASNLYWVQEIRPANIRS